MGTRCTVSASRELHNLAASHFDALPQRGQHRTALRGVTVLPLLAKREEFDRVNRCRSLGLQCVNLRADTPAEFEAWTAEVFNAASRDLDKFKVTTHDLVEGVDGEFDFDATIRYEWAGVSFLVIVEAKRHKNPVKRELVQALHSKVQSVGGHKGVMFSTAGFQREAIEFAKIHGIALVTVTEGRFVIEMKSLEKPAASKSGGGKRMGRAALCRTVHPSRRRPQLLRRYEHRRPWPGARARPTSRGA